MPGKQNGKPRLTRKEKKAQVSGFVQAAKKAIDPLSDLQTWCSYQKFGLDLKLEYKSSKNLAVDDANQVFDLLTRNMQDFYENSDWGWNEAEKKAELLEEDARLLLVRDAKEKIVGFSHFRFDVEVNYPLLYCYELQIESEIQRKGVGKHVMNILTLLAHRFKLLKIVLTVFKDNTAGLNFYMNTLKFRRDETCPYEEEEKCYLILCKFVDENEIKSLSHAK